MNRPSTLTLAQAAHELELRSPDMSQDWGICNADATRLSVFVAYYLQHAPAFEDWGVEHDLGELLLESANDALYGDVGERQPIDAAVHAVTSRHMTAPTRFLLDYWTGLGEDLSDDGEGWPVVSLLREALAAARSSA